jgi:ABC-type branched-subunit amino acid transport system substrate-binding protein
VTFGMRVSLWAREAPRSHVVTTCAIVLALFAGAVALAVPASRHTLAAGRAFPGAQVAGGGDASTNAGGTAADAATGGDAAGGGATAVGANGVARASVAGSKVGTSGGSGASTGAGGSTAGATLKASDNGVTKDTIKVGFLNVQIGGFDATGFALGFRQDLTDVEKALVDNANKEGGVRGRKVIYVTANSDPLSETSMRAGCITMTDDQKVFAVFDQTATTGTALGCFPEKHTPNFTSNAGTVDSSFWQKAGGYLISGGSTFDRGILDWATLSLEDGLIGKGKGKLGILSDDCAPDPDVVDKVLKPFLTKSGVDFADVRLSCDAGTAQQQVSAAALTLRRAGVDRVLLLPLFTSAQSFVQDAEAQAWTPQYLVMDKQGLVLDATTQGFSPTAFDGARGTTYGHSGEDKAGVPHSAGVKRCNDIIVAAGLPPITDQMGKDGLAVAACDAFFTWTQAMQFTPVNPTRADLVAAIPRVGNNPLSAFALKATFGPGKYQGGDAYARVQWQGSCRCWVQIKPPVAARF